MNVQGLRKAPLWGIGAGNPIACGVTSKGTLVTDRRELRRAVEVTPLSDGILHHKVMVYFALRSLTISSCLSFGVGVY